jgi:PAS domain S-box-containing protein
MAGTPLQKDLEERIRHLETRVRVLEKTKNYYRAFFDNSLYGTVIIDPETLRPVEFNDRVCKQLGYTRDEFARLSLPDLEAKEKPEETRAHIQKVFKNGSDEFETLQRTKQGEISNVQVTAQVFNVEDQQVYHCIWRDITQKKRAEETIRKSEKHYRLLTENATDTIWMMSLDGNFLYHSPSVEKLRGYTPSEANQITLEQTLTPESMSLVLGIFHEEKNKPIEERWANRTIELEIYRKDGTTIWVEASVRAVMDENGNVIGLQGSSRNIDERKQAEISLLRSEQKWRNILVNNPQISISLNSDAKIIFANKHFQRLTGWKEEEIVGQDWIDMFIPETMREEIRSVFDQIMSQKDALDFLTYENEILTKSGELRHIGWSNVLTKDANGKILDVTCLGVDLTERIHAEQALKEAKEKFQVLVEQSPLGLSLIDQNGYYRYLNPRFVEMFGYTIEQIPSRSDWFNRAFPDEKYRSMVIKSWITDKQNHGVGESRPRIYIVTCHDGSKKIINFKPVTLRSGDQLVIYEDISEKTKLEDQLRQAQKMESIGTLAGGIAHDFNNILTPLLGYGELLKVDLPEASPLQKYVDEIFRATLRAKDLVKQILTFSRQSGHEMMPVRLQQILKEVLNLCRSSIPSDIEIDWNIQDDCGLAMVDAIQIHQIAMNLITNAYHAVESNGGKIAVELKEVEIESGEVISSLLKPGRYALLSVSDTGCGIDPEIVDNIFEPYFTTKEKGKGTGLGLSLVYGIIREHAGDIKVHSELGKGTTFNVYLPLIEEAVEMFKPNPIEMDMKGNERILLVDDEEVIVRLVKQQLERLGYHVTPFIASPDALEAFKTDPEAFDLVISDMSMPHMTGDQLAKELIDIRADIPVIMCTGFSERINRKKAAAIGIKGFLMKPVVNSKIAEMVRNVLDASKNTVASPGFDHFPSRSL